MVSSFIKLLVISTWVTIVTSASCYWLSEQQSCGSSQQMRLDSNGTRYCCPLRGGDWLEVILCQQKKFEGDCFTSSLRPSRACINADYNDWASSVHTLGRCVRLYVDADCRGRSKAYYPDSSKHSNLGEMIDKVSSVGRCFSHDQVSEGCGRIKRQTDPNRCVFARDVLTVGTITGLTVHYINSLNSPMRWYQVGPNGRIESMEAVIEPRHLGSGTDTNGISRTYARDLGRQDDDAGHILAQLLGGSGTDANNIFPKNSNIDRVKSQVEESVASAVVERGRIRYTVNLEYSLTPLNETRPFKLVYQISDANTHEVIAMNDLINP